MNKHTIRIIISILVLIVILLFVFLFKNQIIEIIRLVNDNKLDEIKQLLTDTKVNGILSIIFIEVLQVIIILIPSFFVHLISGFTYPFYLALLFCLLGVFISSTIIYLLVNYSKLNKTLFKQNDKKINVLRKEMKENISTQLFIYLLFILPIVPIGAICYYSSKLKMNYRRYILTCLTGVIPSILLATLIGNVAMYSFSKGISLWILILIIIVFVILYMFLVSFLIKKYFFNKESKKGPNTILYALYYLFFKVIVQRRIKVYVNNKDIDDFEGPMIILSNHQSVYDSYYISKYIKPLRITMVINRFYFRYRITYKIFKKVHAIPKSLFYPDTETVKEMITAVKNKQTILLFPEGRLCADGTAYPIIDKIGRLIKKLNVPVVIVNINGAYCTKPKWGKTTRRGRVDVYTKRIITVEEIENLSIEDINSLIDDNFKNNEYDYILERDYKYKSNNKAEDISELIYYCPQCHELYTIKGDKNVIECNNCHLKYEIDFNYQLKELSNYNLNINTISKWNFIQKQFEINNINKGIKLETDVIIKRISNSSPKDDLEGRGRCVLTNDEFYFFGKIDNKDLSFSYSIDKLKALPYSGNEEFECYFENNLYYFYPLENKYQVVRWSMIVDEIYMMKHRND